MERIANWSEGIVPKLQPREIGAVVFLVFEDLVFLVFEDLAENAQSPVKSIFYPTDLNFAESSWHNSVKSAARSRKRETASATPTT
jgi:hypothetical protein